jgi:sulfur-oxidizing protein SoxY
MIRNRRQVLERGAVSGLGVALAALGLTASGRVWSQQFVESAFTAKSIPDAFKALGVAAPTESADVLITAPDIAENGAVVPVHIRSNLPRTQSIVLLVEKNPNSIAGGYEILEGMEPEIGMRIKMGQTSEIVAVVRADTRFYMARKEIKVTLGGCGG